MSDILSRVGDYKDWLTFRVVVNLPRQHRSAYHDRHVRIGRRVVYPLGKGLEIFNTTTGATTQVSTISFMADTNNCIEVERQLKVSARNVFAFTTDA